MALPFLVCENKARVFGSDITSCHHPAGMNKALFAPTLMVLQCLGKTPLGSDWHTCGLKFRKFGVYLGLGVYRVPRLPEVQNFPKNLSNPVQIVCELKIFML